MKRLILLPLLVLFISVSFAQTVFNSNLASVWLGDEYSEWGTSYNKIILDGNYVIIQSPGSTDTPIRLVTEFELNESTINPTFEAFGYDYSNEYIRVRFVKSDNLHIYFDYLDGLEEYQSIGYLIDVE